MNYRRSEYRPNNTPIFIALILAAVISVIGGTYYAVCCNSQIAIHKQILETNKRIKQCKEEIQMVEIRIDRMLDRYEIRDEVAKRQLPLELVTHDHIQDVTPFIVDVPLVSQR